MAVTYSTFSRCANLFRATATALDVDPVAVAVAKENARANEVEIEVGEVDARPASLPATDLVVANISLADIEALGPRLLGRGAITSGYLGTDRPDLPGYTPVERRELDGWAADLFERR